MKTTISRIPLSGIYNTRDLGGIKTAEGLTVKPHRLIRSGQLYNMAEDDKRILTETYCLTTIIDFRTENEQQEKPDPVIPGVTHINNPILDDMTAGITHDKQSDRQLTLEEATITMKDRGYDPTDYMRQMYIDIITNEYSLGQYRKFFDMLAAREEGASLWHCSAGKDRVGIGTALLLFTLGVDMDTIMEDYLMTGIFLKEEVDRIIQMLAPRLPSEEAADNIRICMGVDESYMQSVFQVMEDTSGSIARFISDKIGLNREKTETLRSLYLE